MKTIHIRNLNYLGDKFAFTADVMEGKKVVASYSDTARSRAELNGTLKNFKERSVTAEQVQADFATLTEGEWNFIEEDETPVVLSEKEVAEAEKQQKEQELREAVEKAKFAKEVDELASVYPDVATKRDALSSKVIKKG